MAKYQLRVEVTLDDFQQKLAESVERALEEAGIPWTEQVQKKVQHHLNEVLSREMMFDATCGLSLFCQEAVVVPARSEEAEKLKEEMSRPVR